MALMNWPTAKAYDLALLDRATTFTDPAIKQGKLTADASGPIRFNGAGKYVCVYQVSDWFVRCFTETAPPDLRERYRAIAAFVTGNSNSMPFLLEQTWVEQGVHVGDRVVPFLKVPRVLDSQTLGSFLEEHYQNSALVAEIASAFLAMIQHLERAQVAHGDLDITNILIVDDGKKRTLKLIDYDGMYVPAMSRMGLKPIDFGHVHFQHPRTERLRTFGPQMDRFSAVVLYLSLIAIAASPIVWENCGANDTERLLFNETDYLNFTASGSNSYRVLAKLQNRNADILKCLYALEQSIASDQMPGSLEQILAGAGKGEPAPAARGAQPQLFRAIPIPVPEAESRPPERVPLTPPPPGPVPPTFGYAPHLQPRAPVSVFAVLTGVFLACGLLCAIIVISQPASLAVGAIGVVLSILALICDTVILYRAPQASRGWKICILLLALLLLLLNIPR
jgi:hypothetical protein